MELTKEFIEQKVAEQKDYIINMRRWFHENPEVSGQEKVTSEKLEEEFKAMGLSYERAATYGWVVTMECGKPGKRIGLRADIDALPMDEEEVNLKEKRTCVSKLPGAMHACGHDAHMAMMLGAMKILNDVKDQLEGTIFFCFEEGEETGTGKWQMLDILKTKNIDNVWAIHVYAPMETGKISVQAGPRMAGVAGWSFKIKGRGGHGSRPDLSLNPTYPAIQIVTTLESFWHTHLDIEETVTLSIGKFQAGTQGNIIPEYAEVSGSVRFFNMEEGHKARALIEKTIRTITELSGCELIDMNVGFMGSCINDEKASEIATRALTKVLPEGTVTEIAPWYASESFSHYLDTIAPGVLAFLGINNPDKGIGADHHNINFDVDEDAMEIGAASTVAFAIEALNS
jgi:amidohydrolase